MINIKISVIVPIFNADPFLEKCLDSLINQTYPNIEIICVNDGSNDHSLDILQCYSRKDSRIRLINKNNAGVSQARNDALKEVSGDYVMFVDADDWIETDTCETVLRCAIEDQVDIVMWSYCSETNSRSSRKEIYPGKRIFIDSEVKMQLHRRFVGVLGAELAHPELADALCPVWGKLYRRELLRGIEFIDLSEIGTYEDGFFNLAVFGNAGKVVYLPEYFYHYRRSTTGSVTSGYRKDLFAQWQNLFGLIRNYIEENHLPIQYHQALNNRIALSIQGLGLNIVSAKQPGIWMIREIKSILTRPEYREAYKAFDRTYLPIHWKLFYGSARYGCASMVYLLLRIITIIISK